VAVEKRAISKLSKVPSPSRAMRLPIFKQIAELLKRRKEILKGRTGGKGRGLLKEDGGAHTAVSMADH
jgi:hypothetical protein